MWLAGVAGLLPLTAHPAPPPGSTPFLRLGDVPLGYHGSAEDFTNLTALSIGWFGPTNLTDPLTGDLWWAANFAFSEANAADANGERGTGNGKPPFRLVPRWAVDPWGTGVTQLTRMVYEEQPLALLGSVDSAATHLAEQVVAKANLPLVSPVVTDRTATLAGVPWIFACAPSDQAVAAALVEAVGEELRVAPGRLALLHTTDHASRMTARAVRQAFARRGRLPDFQFQARPGAADLAQPRAALVQAQPTVVMVLAGAEDTARWARELQAALPEVSLYGGPEAGRHRFLELAGERGGTVRFPQLVAPDPDDPAWIRFRDEFLAARGHRPDDAAVLTYDAARLLLEAIRRAGPNRGRIREALTELSPWRGVGGEIGFDGTGQNIRTGLRVTSASGPRLAARPRHRKRGVRQRPHTGDWARNVRRCSGSSGLFGSSFL